MNSDDASDRLEVPTPAQRLRALELSGDPDAVEIARRYKSSPLEGIGPALRQVRRAERRTMEALRPTYAQATEDDADEAEERFASIRAERERERKAREKELHDFAKAADRREAAMLKLTWAIAIIAIASLAASAAAVLIAADSL